MFAAYLAKYTSIATRCQHWSRGDAEVNGFEQVSRDGHHMWLAVGRGPCTVRSHVQRGSWWGAMFGGGLGALYNEVQWIMTTTLAVIVDRVPLEAEAIVLVARMISNFFNIFSTSFQFSATSMYLLASFSLYWCHQHYFYWICHDFLEEETSYLGVTTILWY